MGRLIKQINFPADLRKFKKNDLKQISKLIGISILNTEKIYKILLKNKLIY